MNRLTNKEANGRYYIVEEKICIATEQINPITTWITGNENRGYGNPIDKLGILEDIFELIEEMYKKPVYWKTDDGIFKDYYKEFTILYNPKTNEIEIYDYEFIASYKVEEYGLTWAFTEEELKNKEE